MLKRNNCSSSHSDKRGSDIKNSSWSVIPGKQPDSRACCLACAILVTFGVHASTPGHMKSPGCCEGQNSSPAGTPPQSSSPPTHNSTSTVPVRFERPEDRLLPPGPHILRTLPRRWDLPDPEKFLKKQTAAPLRHRKACAKPHMHEWVQNMCPQPRKGFNVDQSPFACMGNKVPEHSKLQSMYDLGLIDFVSVRWWSGGQALLWRKRLSADSLLFFMPVFVSAIHCQQDPYQFLAVKGTLDIVCLLGNHAAHACRAVAQEFRNILAIQKPHACAAVCLVLSHILQEAPDFGRALIVEKHFGNIGPGLNRFFRCNEGVDFGGAKGTDFRTLGECVDYVMRQIETCSDGNAFRRSARCMIKRYIPLYEGPV